LKVSPVVEELGNDFGSASGGSLEDDLLLRYRVVQPFCIEHLGGNAQQTTDCRQRTADVGLVRPLVSMDFFFVRRHNVSSFGLSIAKSSGTVGLRASKVV
jgi:hypothetical protein